MKHFSNLMQRFLLVMLALCASVSVDAYDFEAAHFSKSWPFVNECSLQLEEESGYCGNPDVNEGKNLCYVVTSENDVKTLTIFRNPDAVGNDFGIAEKSFWLWDFSVLVIEDGVTGILSAPGAEALSQALLRAFGEEGQKSAIRAPAAAQAFGARRFAERVEVTYRQAVIDHLARQAMGVDLE